MYIYNRLAFAMHHKTIIYLQGIVIIILLLLLYKSNFPGEPQPVYIKNIEIHEIKQELIKIPAPEIKLTTIKVPFKSKPVVQKDTVQKLLFVSTKSEIQISKDKISTHKKTTNLSDSESVQTVKSSLADLNTKQENLPQDDLPVFESRFTHDFYLGAFGTVSDFDGSSINLGLTYQPSKRLYVTFGFGYRADRVTQSTVGLFAKIGK